MPKFKKLDFGISLYVLIFLKFFYNYKKHLHLFWINANIGLVQISDFALFHILKLQTGGGSCGPKTSKHNQT